MSKPTKHFRYAAQDGQLWVSIDELIEFFDEIDRERAEKEIPVSFSKFTKASLVGIKVRILLDIRDAERKRTI